MTVKELQQAVINFVIADSQKMIDVVKVSYEIMFLDLNNMHWHYIKCHDADQLIKVNNRYRCKKECCHFEVLIKLDTRKKIGYYISPEPIYRYIYITEEFYKCKYVCKGVRS